MLAMRRLGVATPQVQGFPTFQGSSDASMEHGGSRQQRPGFLVGLCLQILIPGLVPQGGDDECQPGLCSVSPSQHTYLFV